MAASEIPPQMANFQTFFLAAFYFLLAAKTAHFAHYYFVLNSSLSAQKQHILVFRNTPNCKKSLFTGVMAISEIPPQMANFQTFFLKDLFFLSRLFLDTLHTAILC